MVPINYVIYKYVFRFCSEQATKICLSPKKYMLILMLLYASFLVILGLIQTNIFVVLSYSAYIIWPIPCTEFNPRGRLFRTLIFSEAGELGKTVSALIQ